MVRSTTPRGKTVTAERAARLYRLLLILADAPISRPPLLRRLKLDVRGFYRDLKLLRSFDIGIEQADGRYRLTGKLAAALDKLPFPDPQLSFGQALQLASGNRPAHKSLRDRIDKLIKPPRKSR